MGRRSCGTRCGTGLGFCLLLAGCSTHSTTTLTDTPAGATAFVGSNSYHYYPDAQVYYAPDRDMYFWRGAAYWGIGERLPSTIALDESPRVEIGLDTDRPYREHTRVLAAFPDGTTTATIDPIYAGVEATH